MEKNLDVQRPMTLGIQNGTTLLELLVAMGLFTVIIFATLGIFNMVIESQRNAMASQNIQESMRYAFEVMSKEVRMAQKSDNLICAGANTNRVYNQPDITALFFVNKDGSCTTYSLVGGRIQVDRGGFSGFLTPSIISISNLKFNIVDENSSVSPMSIQPKVSIIMDAEMASGEVQHKQKVKIQTTISARFYE